MKALILLLTLLILTFSRNFRQIQSEYFLETVFFNVGQGDSALLSHSGSNILIDGGPGSDLVAEKLKSRLGSSCNITVLIATHSHRDHLAGLVDVLNSCNVKLLVRSFDSVKTKTVSQFEVAVREAFRSGRLKLVMFPESRDFIQVGELTIRFVWPEKFDDPKPESLIFLVEFGEVDALFTGDASIPRLTSSLKNIPRPVEIFKIPHHGSKNSYHEQFISLISPRLSVVQVGKNSYGHPYSQFLKFLDEAGSLVFRTDRDGDVVILTDGFKIYVMP